MFLLFMLSKSDEKILISRFNAQLKMDLEIPLIFETGSWSLTCSSSCSHHQNKSNNSEEKSFDQQSGFMNKDCSTSQSPRKRSQNPC